MSPVFVIFCIIAFLIQVGLCFYYKHKVAAQSTELEVLKEKEEQAQNEYIHSIMYGEADEERAWQDVLVNAIYLENPPEECWRKMAVEFADRKAILESFKMTDTYKGLLEGSLAYASMGYWNDAQQAYSGEGHLLLKPTLVPAWTRPHEWCLPKYKVEIEVGDGTNHLWLCWFTSDVPQASLADFVNAQTRSIDFSTHCKKYMDD